MNRKYLQRTVRIQLRGSRRKAQPRTPLFGIDVFDHDFEAVLLVKRNIPWLERLEVARQTLGVGPLQLRTDKRAAEALPLARRFHAQELQVQMLYGAVR